MTVHVPAAAVGRPRAGSWKLLEHRHRQLLLLLGAVSFFEGYDLNIITVALKPLRATFGLDQAQAAGWIAVVFLGALPAIGLSRYADRHGRRGLLVWSMVAYSVATGATALVPDLAGFVAVQFAARFFLVLQSVLVWTVVAEELPAGARGLGFGWLAMLSAFGTGWAAILWGTVLSPLGASWRWLYVAAVPLLLVVLTLRRRLPETERFQSAALVRHAGWRAILRAPHRSRLLALVSVAVLANLTAQATVYVVDFMQTERHLSASAASLTLVASGALAIPILLVAGSVSDRLGRKPVLCGFMVLSVVGFGVFFFVARGELALFLSLALAYAGSFGSWPTGTGFGAELFPTDLRAFGNSFGAGARYFGQAASFVVAGGLMAGAGSLSRAVLILSAGPLLAAGLVALLFPETGGRELEDINLVPEPVPSVVGRVPGRTPTAG